MAKETYYDVLGVRQDASEADIKKAYRKLVRKYHPDVSQDPQADEMTSKINQAYNILKNKEKRAEYDEMLRNPFAGKQQTGSQYNNGFDFSHFSGGQGYQFRPEDFGNDAPFGQGSFRFDDIFSAFGSRQSRQQSSPIRGEDQHAELQIDPAVAYYGAKHHISLNIPIIDAQGQYSHQPKTLNVSIPKGICEGQQIRLAGQGLPGINGGPAGDLFLKIRFKEKGNIHIEHGKDVHIRVNVFPWQVALAEKISITLPDGALLVQLPKSAQQGQKIRLKGKGIPAKEAGDAYIHLNIVMPNAINEEDEKVWQSLANHYHKKEG